MRICQHSNQQRLAKSIGVSQRCICEIVAGKRAVTADKALRLARLFGTDAQSGLTSKPTMIWRSPKRDWKADWIRKSLL
ncbi:MAG: transcriptional regulator [Syntrophobacteraceae bacterium]